jgi:hypothetical protein
LPPYEFESIIASLRRKRQELLKFFLLPKQVVETEKVCYDRKQKIREEFI